MKQPLTGESTPHRVSLDDCLKKNVKWLKANDPTALWRARVRGETWTIRVNDFPEEQLYTLFVNDDDLGSFDEWPRQWSRTEDATNPKDSMRVPAPPSEDRPEDPPFRRQRRRLSKEEAPPIRGGRKLA